MAQSQLAQKIRTQTDTIESEANMEIVEIRGKVDAEAKLIVANAKAKAKQGIIQATSTAYKVVKSQIGFTPKDNLHKFIYLTQLQKSDNIDMYFGVNKALISLKS